MDKLNDNLLTEKISSLVLKYSLPAIVVYIMNILYNFIDAVFIGNQPYAEKFYGIILKGSLFYTFGILCNC